MDDNNRNVSGGGGEKIATKMEWDTIVNKGSGDRRIPERSDEEGTQKKRSLLLRTVLLLSPSPPPNMVLYVAGAYFVAIVYAFCCKNADQM